MKYVGIQQQIARNNRLSVIYLLAFPTLILLTIYGFLYFTGAEDEYGYKPYDHNEVFVNILPYVLVIVLIWFLIAYFTNTSIIKAATSAHTLSRRENMRVYNLVENLCMQEGMRMPKIHVIEDPALNAFASGIDERSYTVTLTRGIINELNDEELKGVIAHELMHIKNGDVRLLVISIIFVGIISFIMRVLLRIFLSGGNNKRSSKGSGGYLAFIAIVLAIVAYILSLVFKFGLSRSREYMADSGAAEMTKNPLALASALRKISGNSVIKSVTNDDVKQLFIEHKPEDSTGFIGLFSGLFATHPPIEKRIKLLEQF